jgi:hypothetical protein
MFFHGNNENLKKVSILERSNNKKRENSQIIMILTKGG